jgi:hypothetical protein
VIRLADHQTRIPDPAPAKCVSEDNCSEGIRRAQPHLSYCIRTSMRPDLRTEHSQWEPLLMPTAASKSCSTLTLIDGVSFCSLRSCSSVSFIRLAVEEVPARAFVPLGCSDCLPVLGSNVRNTPESSSMIQTASTRSSYVQDRVRDTSTSLRDDLLAPRPAAYVAP